MLNKRLQTDIEIDEDMEFEMCSWEADNVAFIKHDLRDGKAMWSIYDADGERIASTDNREFAFIVARQNDLTPFSAH